MLARAVALGGGAVVSRLGPGGARAQEGAATPDDGARPWPRPTAPWLMTQVWSDLLFAHWSVPPDALRPLLPPGLALDTFAGSAWVAVVPFRMSDLRLRGLPAPPAAFPELNVRTYAVAEDRPGVWFLSLDAADPVAVAFARERFHLPYYEARMEIAPAPGGEGVDFSSVRTHGGAPPAALSGRYGPTGAARAPAPGSLEHWLVERYCLYAAAPRGRLFRTEVDHAPWELQPAEAEFTINTMAAAAGIALPDDPPLLHFARRQEVVAWAPQEVGR